MGAAAHILVVDDDADLRKSLVELLEEQGYDVAGAANGEEALAALERRRPAVILLDLTMPIMDGWTFRRRQLGDARIADIPTVVISASYSDERHVATLRADAFLAKPFDLSHLTEALRRASRGADAPPPRPVRAAPPPPPAARAAAPRPAR